MAQADELARVEVDGGRLDATAADVDADREPARPIVDRHAGGDGAELLVGIVGNGVRGRRLDVVASGASSTAASAGSEAASSCASSMAIASPSSAGVAG